MHKWFYVANVVFVVIVINVGSSSLRLSKESALKRNMQQKQHRGHKSHLFCAYSVVNVRGRDISRPYEKHSRSEG